MVGCFGGEGVYFGECVGIDGVCVEYVYFVCVVVE